MAPIHENILIWSIITFIISSTRVCAQYGDTSVKFTREPQDVIGLKGQTSKLGCEVSRSFKNVEYVWYKDGAPLSGFSGGASEGGNRRYTLDGSDLVLTGLVRKHEASYFCAASHKNGTIISRSANVSVIYPSRVKVDISPEVVRVGDNVLMSCAVREAPAASLFLTWFLDGQLVAMDNNRFSMSHDGALRIQSVRSEDAGNYTCMLTSGSDSFSAQAQLILLPSTETVVPGYVLMAPQNASYRTGQDAKLECFAAGFPRPDIKWYKDGQVIPNYADHLGYVMKRNGNLLMPNVDLNKTGRYTCEVNSPVNKVVSEAYLTIAEPPLLRETSENPLIRRSSATLRLWCHVDGEPVPEITWTHNGVSLEPGAGRIKYQQGGNVLVVSQCVNDDSGYYQCWARNAGGVASAIIRAYIPPPQEGAPDPPVNIRVREVSTSSITLVWTPAAEKEGLSAFAYSIHYQPADGGPELQKVVVNDTSATVQHLMPDSVYTFYLLAYNSRGSSQQSEKIQLPTASLDGPPVFVPDDNTANTNKDPDSLELEPPTDVQGRALNATAILVGWDRPEIWDIPATVAGTPVTGGGIGTGGGASNGGDSGDYVVRLRLQDDSAQALLGLGPPDINIAVSRTELVLKDLRPFSTYIIDVCSRQAGKRSDYSRPPLRITTEQAAPSEPVNVQVTLLNAESARVTWDPPRHENGIITFYNIYYTTQPHKELWQWDLTQQNGVAESGVINGLAANQVYYIRLTAETIAGSGSRSLQRTLQTTTSTVGHTQGSFLGAGEREKFIILVVCIGGFCIVACILIILLRNRCFPQPADAYATRKHSRGQHAGGAPGGAQHASLLHDSTYHEMDSFVPMLPPPIVNEHCDTKGGYDTYPGRCHFTRLHGLNGVSGGRTRTVSSGYTSDRDLDDPMQMIATSEGDATDPISVDVSRLDEIEDAGLDRYSLIAANQLANRTRHTQRWLDSPSSLAGSLTGSRDSNKDSGTGTECATNSGSRTGGGGGGGGRSAHSGSVSTLTPHCSSCSGESGGGTCASSADSSPQRSGSDGYLPESSRLQPLSHLPVHTTSTSSSQQRSLPRTHGLVSSSSMPCAASHQNSNSPRYASNRAAALPQRTTALCAGQPESINHAHLRTDDGRNPQQQHSGKYLLPHNQNSFTSSSASDVQPLSSARANQPLQQQQNYHGSVDGPGNQGNVSLSHDTHAYSSSSNNPPRPSHTSAKQDTPSSNNKRLKNPMKCGWRAHRGGNGRVTTSEKSAADNNGQIVQVHANINNCNNNRAAATSSSPPNGSDTWLLSTGKECVNEDDCHTMCASPVPHVSRLAINVPVASMRGRNKTHGETTGRRRDDEDTLVAKDVETWNAQGNAQGKQQRGAPVC